MKKILILALALFFINITYAQSELVVIVNSTNPVTTLTKKHVKSYFLGTLKITHNKARAKPVYNIKNEEFWLEFLNTTYDRFVIYWTRKVFSGYGTAPGKYDNDAKVIEYVAKNKGGIGVVNKSSLVTLGAGVKVVKIAEVVKK